MKSLAYPIFFLLAFSFIGWQAVKAWKLVDSRVVRELQQAAVLR